MPHMAAAVVIVDNSNAAKEKLLASYCYNGCCVKMLTAWRIIACSSQQGRQFQVDFLRKISCIYKLICNVGLNRMIAILLNVHHIIYGNGGQT